MLANPIVVPAYATPEVWLMAFVATWAEIRTEFAMLRRWGWGPDVMGSLLLVNLLTWVCFLVAMDRLDDQVSSSVWMVTVLEAGVVVVETVLFWAVLRCRARATAARAIPWLGALAVSLVGNLVSIVVSVALSMAIYWMRR